MSGVEEVSDEKGFHRRRSRNETEENEEGDGVFTGGCHDA